MPLKSQDHKFCFVITINSPLPELGSLFLCAPAVTNFINGESTFKFVSLYKFFQTL